MRPYSLSKFVLGCLAILLLTASPSQAKLKLQKAKWDQEKQRLEVKVEAEGVGSISIEYGGAVYPLDADKERKHFRLVLSPVCYSPSVNVVASEGEAVTSAVEVEHGDGTWFLCDSGASSGTLPKSDVVVIATNDLGMHCACPGSDGFLLLPPFNTLRAQVFQRKGENPRVMADPAEIRVEYNILEEDDSTLQADPYFQDWIVNAPKLFPGFQPVRADGHVQGLTGATLSGEMEAKAEGWWEAAGIPAFPVVTGGAGDIMTDPLGGPNRDPYLTAEVKVYDQTTGDLLASTKTNVPVAFGGCCGCHLQVAADYGYPATPTGSFETMGMLHERHSGIDFSTIDIDGDGVGGPVRCSWCHWDPAMGEAQAPGVPGHPEYPVSSKSFSEVLHGFHSQSSAVLSYDPDIASNCYQCHPGNNVNCYRGHHVGKGMWCTDCHGDLNQRVAQGQLKNPWSDQTLPTCSQCHGDVGEGSGYLHMGIFGAYLNSMGHKKKVLCSTCHGEPHALYPSTFADDNWQMQQLQGSDRPLGTCGVCHQGKGGYGKPPHDKGGFTNGTTGGGSGSGGTEGGVDAGTELQTTCLNCHGDKSGLVSCSNGKWAAHNGTRVSSQVFAAVSLTLAGDACGAGQAGVNGGSQPWGGGADAATALQTTCLSCHGDKSGKVSCSKGDWLAHDGSRVSATLFDAVSAYLTGASCQGQEGVASSEEDDD